MLSRLLRFHGSNVGLENFFTEIFAHLLSTYPDLCFAWLNESGVLPINDEYSHINVTTQRPFDTLGAHGRSSRPDVVIELSEGFSVETGDDHHWDEMPVPPTDVVVVESKIGSPEGEDHQLRRYAEHLSAIPDIRHRRLVYITREYDPKDEDDIVGGLRGSDASVEFRALRWYEFYRTLEAYRSTLLPGSDLIQEVLLFMKQNGMSQTNRLSAADVVALSGMTRISRSCAKRSPASS